MPQITDIALKLRINSQSFSQSESSNFSQCVITIRKVSCLKASLRIRFLVSKTGSRRSDGPISRFRFCGENVGRSFVLCSHDPFFRTKKESSICHQNNHAKFVGAFHLSRRVSDENKTCSISIRFFKITDPFCRRSLLMCSHYPFFETNKNRILKNGSCEQAFRVF